MGECGSGARCIGLIPEVHGRDKTVVHGEHMKNFAIPKNIALEVLYERDQREGESVSAAA